MSHPVHWLACLLLHRANRDALGYAASSLVLATFCMTSMWRLRITAIISNLAFMAYGWMDDVRPVLLLHCILLPVNAFRLVQLALADRPAVSFRTIPPTHALKGRRGVSDRPPTDVAVGINAP